MSRSGYTEDLEDQWALIRWRGAVASATRGKRGQRLFRDLLTALDAMPVKRLIAHELVNEGEVCALGALGQARKIDLSKVDAEDPEAVADAFEVAPALAQEIVYMNDEHFVYGADWEHRITPEQRWQKMRAWVAAQIGTGYLPPPETPKP